MGVMATAAVTCCAGAADPGQVGEPPQYGWRLSGDAFLRLGEGLETPHTRWMKPAAAGTVRALFLVNKIAAYDVGELGRRLDLEIRGMPAETWLRLGDNYWLWLWHESSSNPERSAHFEAMLDDEYDVIVLGNCRFLSLYESVQYKILKKVAGGCGLVMFYPHDLDPRMLRHPLPEAAQQLSVGIPFAGLTFYRNLFMLRKDLNRPDEIGGHLFRAYQFGRGRVLEVDYATQSSVFDAVPGAITPFEDYDYTSPVQYDYHQALAARCLMWAAGREPRLAWTRPLPDRMEIAALAESPADKVECQWSGAAGITLTRRTRVRNRWGDVAHEHEESFRADAGVMSWETVLPPLPAGTHFVDFIVSSADGVENWGSFAVDVRSSLWISAVEPADSFFERGQDVTGRVLLSRRVTDDEEVALLLTLQDGYDRVFSMARRGVQAATDRVEFRIPQGNLIAWGARLRVKLSLGGRTADQDEVELWFRRPGRGEFPIAMWGAIPGYGNHIGNLQMRKLGFTAVLAGHPINQARDDLGWMTFGGGRGALVHSLGDEIQVPHPKKGEVFGDFLKRRYDSIDELDAAWKTSYTAWEEAEPGGGVEDGSAASFVRYHDSLSCGESLHAERCREGRESVEKTNPQGVVGPEGSPVGDPELTLPEVTFWGPYLTVRDNLLVTAIARPGTLRGNWFGGYVEDRQVPTRLRHVLWLSILGGNNMIEYFTISGGLLAPDLTRMPFTDQFMKSWHQLRRGLGPLLAKCRPAGNPVALLHSQPSEHVGRAGGQWTDTTKVHAFMLDLLGDAGYGPQYVASGQVKAGRLQDGDIKVLFLLHAFALSDDEIAGIVTFAEKGGTVIADIPPAWFDERCRLRELRALDAFFGLQPAAPQASLKWRRSLMGETAEVEVAGGVMHLRGRDASLVAAGSETFPDILERAHGHGRSVLLNGVVWQEGRANAGTARALRQLLSDRARTPRAFEPSFRHPLGKPGMKVYSYERGDIRIDAVLPPEATDPAVPVVPRVRWSEAKHTYDLREESYLGHLDRLEQRVDRSSPLVVARLDYRVGGVRIDAPAAAGIGDVLTLACHVLDDGGKPRPGHVVRVKVEGPTGIEYPYYGAILDAIGPEQSWRIPFAMNDQPGQWRITATDVVSGQSATASIRLSKGQHR